jgi:hypothetical protein
MSHITIQDLEVLIAEAPPPAAVEVYRVPKVTARDARHQVLGAIKIIARMSGMDMTRDVHPTELLVERIDNLEAEIDVLRKELEAAKAAKQDEIAGYKKALRNIAARLEIYRQPFENLPFSKWKNDAKGKWMLAVGETVDWAVQRADNQLDPVNAVVIAPDED